MAKTYSLTITDGQATEAIVNGTYAVTGTVAGYDETSIDPASLTISDELDTYELTVEATGTLTLHVSEDGTTAGQPIEGAIFYRCDSEGTTYGNAITTLTDGTAIFEHVPYLATGTAPTVYYKQTASDGSHNFDATIKQIVLSQETTTVEILNAKAATKNVKLTDANYEGLPIGTATLTLTEQ